MIDLEALSTPDLASLQKNVESEFIRRKNVAVVEAELASLQKQQRDSGVSVSPPNGGAWQQPSGAHEAYAATDVVSHKSKRWVSLVAFNVWEPGVAGWREEAKPADPSTEEPTAPPDFLPPSGAADAYKVGDRITFQGKVYISLIEGNVWSPADYPQGWREE